MKGLLRSLIFSFPPPPPPFFGGRGSGVCFFSFFFKERNVCLPVFKEAFVLPGRVPTCFPVPEKCWLLCFFF